jgi:menaquinone-dependent protoporphyrinogen IX oxidase
MKVLIAVSSKHGSTAEIAASIGETFRETGIDVDVVDVKEVESVAPYDAVIVGSAVHNGPLDGACSRPRERLRGCVAYEAGGAS